MKILSLTTLSMKALFTPVFILAAVGAGLPGTLKAEPATFEIDDEHFSIAFLVDHVGYANQLGQFLQAEGRFVYDEDANELHSGEVIIQADSVFTNHERRDNHLRDSDFLHADRHATIRFEATEWQPGNGRSGTLVGELTLLGETRPVELDVTLNKAAEYPFGHQRHTLGFSARASIERSEWGMTYGIDDGLVGDTVELIFEFEAIEQ